MNTPRAAAPRRYPASALTLLFARYVAGQIAESQWQQFADVFDGSDATAEERSAFARFYLDASNSPDAGDVKLPRADELKDLLTLTR
jgi:hypothetical protein